MAKVVVLGVSGGFGGWMARVFVESGWQVTGLCRHPERVEQMPSEVVLAQADVGETDQWARYCAPGDVLVYAVNPPYDQWHAYALPYLQSALEVAISKRLTVLFPGNVYVFDPAEKPEFCERDMQRPPTQKGEIRRQMEARLQQASERGARVLVLRAGDFIDPYAERSNWFKLLLNRTSKGMVLKSPGPDDVVHSWAYLPDMARTFERLLQCAHALPAYSVFHYRGVVASAEQLAQALRLVEGGDVQLRTMSWLPLRLLGALSPMMREVVQMRYLWERALVLDDRKLQRQLCEHGGVPETPLPEALQRTLGLGDLSQPVDI